MGLIDSLLRTFLGRSGGATIAKLLSGPMLGIVLGMLKGGGLGGLLDKFKGAGLTDKADTWVSTGPNAPLDADEVERALGPNEIQEIAQKTGLSVDEVRQQLATGLPEVVNHLTPKGEVPDEGTVDGMLEKLGQFLPK